MYIEQAYKSLHEGWRYIIGFIIIFIFGWQLLGAIPLGISAFLRADDFKELMSAGLENFMPLYKGENNLYLALVLFTFVGGLIALVAVVKYLHKQKFIGLVTARKKIDWGRVFFAFGIWAAFSIITTMIAYYLSPEDLQWNFNLMPFLGLLAVTLLLLPLQTSFEEFLFRGYLMQGIGIAAKNRAVPLIITSLVFGLMHALNPEIEKLGYSVLSVYIGLGFLGQIIPIFIILPILTIIFAKKYKWSGWKEKLFGKVHRPEVSHNDIA